jgi:hypothetical protein
MYSSCVQKTYTKTVIFQLTVPSNYQPKTVGIRGDDKPLSWEQDIAMTAVVKDSVYTTTVTFVTGYKFTSVKFVVNEEFELQDQNNRRINFSNNSDTTYYSAHFNTISNP